MKNCLLFCLLATAVQAQVALDRCEASPRVESKRYLRQLSLDLRGRGPNFEELSALKGEVSKAQIRSMLDSKDFKKQLALFHQDLLWPNLSNVDITSFVFDMYPDGNGVWGRPFQGIVYRGAPGVSCLNEPARVVGGVIQTTPMPSKPENRQEGYVMVEPYWAKGTQIKVCAFDANPNLISETGVACNSSQGASLVSCGCGPNLNFCQAQEYRYKADGSGYYFSTKNMIREALQAEALQIIDDVVSSGRPYLDILRTNRGYINGPLAHFYRFQTGTANFVMTPSLIPLDVIPTDISVLDETLRPIERDSLHAGVLTTGAYLLRFQTNRARANRFSNAFLCSAFLPPPGGLPSPDSDCSREPNLQSRCGCKYCHVALEPMATYWGRFAQNGMALRDAVSYPAENPECVDCDTNIRTCSLKCRLSYVTKTTRQEDAPFLGKLKELEYVSASNEANLAMGPKLLVERSIFNDRLPGCVAKSVWKYFLGRPMTTIEEVSVLPQIVEAFVKSGFDFKTLVESVVTSEAYRSIG
jgi:Protein of unknown function (DUF1585)